MRYLIGALALTLAACGGSEPDVDWNNYPPGTKQQIDRLADQHRCRALTQLAFANTANAFSGEPDTALTDYIDEKMQDADC